MKILWLCNIPLPEYSEKVGMLKNSGGGWLTGLKNELVNNSNIELSICFPQNNIDDIKELNINGVFYFAVPRKILDTTKMDNDIEQYFQIIIDKIRPDIIHIWGTEYPHTLSMVNICEKKKYIKPNSSIYSRVSFCFGKTLFIRFTR